MPIHFTHTFQTEAGLELAFTVGGSVSGAVLRVVDTKHEAPDLESILTVEELAELRSLLGALLKQAHKNATSSTSSTA